MLYAQTSGIRARQIITDGLVGAWCLLWALVGWVIYKVIDKLSSAIEYLADAAGSAQGTTNGANNRLPSALRGPLDSLGGLTGSINDSAQQQADAAHHMAIAVGLGIAAVPILLVGGFHLYRRLRWARDAAALREMAKNPGFERLLAQRALATQPISALGVISSEMNENDIRLLAYLEGERLGLRHPRNPKI